MFSFVRDQATAASACVRQMYFPAAWNTLPNMGGQVPRAEPGRLFDTLFTPPHLGGRSEANTGTPQAMASSTLRWTSLGIDNGSSVLSHRLSNTKDSVGIDDLAPSMTEGGSGNTRRPPRSRA